MTDQSLPHSLEAEASVLGCILLRGAEAFRDAHSRLSERSWHGLSHRATWVAISSVVAAGRPVDVLTVYEELVRTGQEGMITPAELSRLMDGIPRLMNLDWYVGIVQEKEIRRNIIRHAQELSLKALDEDVQETLAWNAKRTVELSSGLAVERDQEIADTMAEVLDAFEARSLGGTHGLTTGFWNLDWATGGGFEAGDLVVLAGRTSSGKTALALNIVRHVGLKLGKPVIIHSMEMSRTQIAMRIACQEGGINILDFRRGSLSERDLNALVRVYERLRSTKIIIDDDASPTMARIEARCRRRMARDKPALIVLDQLGTIRPATRSDNPTHALSELALGAKALARNLGVPVLVTHQLNRAPEGGDKAQRRRPVLRDLRQSGDVENQADLVLFIYRADESQEKLDVESAQLPHQHRDAELIIAKQRNGPPGTVALQFLPASASFRSVESKRS